jgi:hypothetical protein
LPSKPRRGLSSASATRWNAIVVPGQSFVHERVVGGQQVQRRPILADDAAEEELDLAAEGQRQRVAVVGEEERVGHDVGQPP